MSDITLINDSEQSSLVTNGLAKNGELYLKKEGSTNAGSVIVYDNGSWSTFANEAAPPYSNTYSVSFDGTNDYMTSSPVTPSAQQGTISAWIKTTAGGPIFSWSNLNYNPPSGTTRPLLSVRSTGELDYLFQQQHSGSVVNRIRSTSTVNDNNWHHVVVTSNGSSWAMYIDGSAASTTIPNGSNTGQWVGDIYSLNSAFVAFSDIGAARRHPTIGGNSYFNGSIDEVAVWDSALSSSDISSIYNSGVPNDISSLSPAGWWRLGDNDSGTGTTITDQGSEGNDGTLTNGPSFSTDIPS
jgi:hypothetical protein